MKVKELVEYLICPECKTNMILDTKREEIVCNLGHRYKIINNIPRILVDAKAVDEQQSFAFKWRRFANVAFNSKTIEFEVGWQLRKYGWNSLDSYKDFLKDKKYILDAGSGLGRWSAMMSNLNKDALIFSVEITESVDIAYQQYRDISNIYFIQGDISKLPFPNEFFDYIFCEGVIHHTPNPYRTFVHLISKLKKGGEIAMYVYKKKTPIREFCDDFVRAKLGGLSEEEALKFARAVTLFGKALSELNIEIEVPEDIPILEIKKGKYNLQRFFYYNIFKCFWNDEMGYEASVSTNFDWYFPKYAFRFTPKEINDWFDSVGVSIVHMEVEESGITVRGVK
jgi:SAM-dependent methyltransferase